MRKIASGSGTSFDPQVIKALLRRCHDFEQIAELCPEDATPLQTETSPDWSGDCPFGGHRAGDFLASIVAARQEVQALFEFVQDLGSSLALNETLSLVVTRVKRMIPMIRWLCTSGSTMWSCTVFGRRKSTAVLVIRDSCRTRTIGLGRTKPNAGSEMAILRWSQHTLDTRIHLLRSALSVPLINHDENAS